MRRFPRERHENALYGKCSCHHLAELSPYAANPCPLSVGVELACFGEDFGESIGELIKTMPWSADAETGQSGDGVTPALSASVYRSRGSRLWSGLW
jgi:hypothetical protein